MSASKPAVQPQGGATATRPRARGRRASGSSPRHTRKETSASFAPGGRTPNLPSLVDIATVAESLGVGVRHVRRLVAERRIPFVKVGHYVRFDPDMLATWIDERRVDAARH